MCDCVSYNRPDLGGGDPSVLRNGVPLDPCIADTIEALWAAGIKTLASCCSHNGKLGPAPNVVIAEPARACDAAEIIARSDAGRTWQILIWVGARKDGEDDG